MPIGQRMLVFFCPVVPSDATHMNRFEGPREILNETCKIMRPFEYLAKKRHINLEWLPVINILACYDVTQQIHIQVLDRIRTTMNANNMLKNLSESFSTLVKDVAIIAR